MTPKLAIAAAVLLSTLALAGCGVEAPAPTTSATPTATAEPTAAPTPSVTPTPAPTVNPSATLLFTISATLTSPVGAVASVKQAVYSPTGDLDDEAEIVARLDEGCPVWDDQSADVEYVVSTITTKDLSKGGKEWSPSGQVSVSLSGFPVFDGDYEASTSSCSPVLLLVPGIVRGVTPVPAGGDPDARGGWGTVAYGFSVPIESGTDAADERYTQLSDCTITVSAAARRASAFARDWPDLPQLEGTCQVSTTGT